MVLPFLSKNKSVIRLVLGTTFLFLVLLGIQSSYGHADQGSGLLCPVTLTGSQYVSFSYTYGSGYPSPEEVNLTAVCANALIAAWSMAADECEADLPDCPQQCSFGQSQQPSFSNTFCSAYTYLAYYEGVTPMYRGAASVGTRAHCTKVCNDN